jgi:hypothetical protein
MATLLATFGSARTTDERDDCLPMGLYDLPSYLNHSCVAHAVFFFYGDFIMIHAVTNLARGEEVTIEYLPASDDMDRQQRFEVSFWFDCDCAMCLEQSRNPSIEQRKEICARIDDVIKREGTPANIRELEGLRLQLEETYHNDKYRVNLFDPLSALAEWYEDLKEYKKAILAHQKAITHCTSITPIGIQRILNFGTILSLAYQSACDEYVLPAQKSMLNVARVYAGVPEDVFIQVWIPALSKCKDTLRLNFLRLLFPIKSEEQLKRNREIRRRNWTEELRKQKRG